MTLGAAFFDDSEIETQEHESDDESIGSFDSASEDEAIQSIQTDKSSTSESPHRQQTRKFVAAHRRAQTLASSVKAVLKHLKEKQLNLAVLLEAVFWGCEELVDDSEARWARTVLLSSEQLPSILQRWYKPPAKHNKSHNRGQGARSVMAAWADHNVISRMDKELHQLTKFYRPPEDFLTESFLLSIKFKDIVTKFMHDAPTTWNIFRRSVFSRRQEKRNSSKIPDLVS
jgi:hypothetical protein